MAEATEVLADMEETSTSPVVEEPDDVDTGDDKEEKVRDDREADFTAQLKDKDREILNLASMVEDLRSEIASVKAPPKETPKAASGEDEFTDEQILGLLNENREDARFPQIVLNVINYKAKKLAREIAREERGAAEKQYEEMQGKTRLADVQERFLATLPEYQGNPNEFMRVTNQLAGKMGLGELPIRNMLAYIVSDWRNMREALQEKGSKGEDKETPEDARLEELKGRDFDPSKKKPVPKGGVVLDEEQKAAMSAMGADPKLYAKFVKG